MNSFTLQVYRLLQLRRGLRDNQLRRTSLALFLLRGFTRQYSRRWCRIFASRTRCRGFASLLFLFSWLTTKRDATESVQVKAALVGLITLQSCRTETTLTVRSSIARTGQATLHTRSIRHRYQVLPRDKFQSFLQPARHS